MTSTYRPFFQHLAGLATEMEPHPWQQTLGEGRDCPNRLIRVPTGFGKTFGVLGAWVWNRVERADPAWPRRLVWCLPMRVLVEQVADEVRNALARSGGAAGRVAVHTLMGGIDATDWHIAPEQDAVLIGTQDMLLSRALNRGYGAARARWPMDFGLLNQDCLWVMDEVQLMDVGLATSAQLQAFRDDDSGRALRACRTWWMSATLQPDWLTRSPDTQSMMAAMPSVTAVPSEQRHGLLWDGVRKPVRVEAVTDSKRLAAAVVKGHLGGRSGNSGPTLVVVNRVARAVEVHDEIRRIQKKNPDLVGTDLRLVHSRYRPAEREGWRGAFLNRQACGPGTDRIIVATQVVEAGVDMSASLLFTDLAPWPSLVQRFGRAARWGGDAQVVVIDTQPKDDKSAAPYSKAELDAARDALVRVTDVAPQALESFEEGHPDLLAALYPYQPMHILLRQEVDELFDTAPDLSGTDIDISRFIRSGEERDVLVFWRSVPPKVQPAQTVHAGRDELCAVPFMAARDWLCAKERLKPGRRAWVWDWLDGKWRTLERRDIYPGRTLLVDTKAGGYDPVRGWDPDAKPELLLSAALRMPPAPSTAAVADESESDESLSATAQWQTIGYHGLQVGRQANLLSRELAPMHAELFDLAGRWHDAGKAHPAFQGSLRPHSHGDEIAKAPQDQWRAASALYRMPDGSHRAGFRHELASVLALFALLRRCYPDHPALLGPWRDLLSRTRQAERLPPASCAPPDSALTPLEREVIALDAPAFDLLLYLVCSHHGKVRVSWQSSPADQASNDSAPRIRGVRSGDVLPTMALVAADGTRHRVPAAEMLLAAASVGLNTDTGRGWTERVLGLLDRHGPFTLAWMEALMRAADQRASRDATLRDPALEAAVAVTQAESGEQQP